MHSFSEIIFLDDQVYMYEKDEPLLLEYVLNEAGKIYAGNWQKPTAKPWDFGQVNDNLPYFLLISVIQLYIKS